MNTEDKIDIALLKTVHRAMAESDNLDIVATHLSQLLVAALGIKGCTLFALNPDANELEILASFGLSANYLNKGPVLFDQSIAHRPKGEVIVISDTGDSTQLQYPEATQAEGIRAIVNLPVLFRDKTIGALRLYENKPWTPSDRDQDALRVLAETIGLAMMVTRLATALGEVKETVDSVHGVWLGL